MKRVLSGFLLLLFLMMSLSCGWADPNLTLQDSSVRAGPWAETYAAILRERAAGIQAYQEYVTAVTYSTVCHPVGLQDLTGDGVPELLFVENVHDTEYGFELGRLWIYTSDGNSTHCALSLQPETDDLLYSELFTGEGDLLTFRFTDMESSWILQFRMDQSGRYALRTELISQEDFSGEGPDQYFLNGKEISADVYRQEETWIRSTQGTAVGSLQVDDGQSGFDWTLEEALAVLGSGTVSEIPQPGQGATAAASTSPSGGLLPEEFCPSGKTGPREALLLRLRALRGGDQRETDRGLHPGAGHHGLPEACSVPDRRRHGSRPGGGKRDDVYPGRRLVPRKRRGLGDALLLRHRDKTHRPAGVLL